MPEARAEHTATWIPNDTIVVIGGGGTRALVFDPNLGEWTPKGTAQTDRYGHAAVNTGDDVLVIGGSSTPLPAEDAMKSVEIFDVSTGEFTSQPAMRYGRHGHTATVLDNGRVLVVGKARNAEIYDTFTDQWSVTATPPTAGRSYHAAVELQSDELGAQVLFVGGLFGNTTYDSSEFFVPNGERWTRLDLRMNSKRFAHQATALTPGMVLLTGGQEGFGDPLAVTELVTFIEPGEPCETAGECFTGHCVDGVCCESACDGGCQACSERRGSSADGACDVLGEGIDCWAGVDTCEVKSSCDGVSPTCDVSEFPTDGATCNDGLDETGNDRCQQGTCRGTRRVEPPPPGGAAGTGGEPGSGGTGGSAGGGGTAGTGGGSGGAPPERDDATEAVPTPLSCSVGRSAPAGEPVGSAGWWMLFGLILGTRRERGRYK
jgi:hypothetical protein